MTNKHFLSDNNKALRPTQRCWVKILWNLQGVLPKLNPEELKNQSVELYFSV